MKKKLKIMGLALCGAVTLACGSLAVKNMQNANAESELIVPKEYIIEKEYTYGETFEVLAPSLVRIKTGATETTAVSAVLIFPDGTAKSEGSYTLDKNGVYELTYYDANGVSATQKFVVNKNYYGIDEGASASYVTDLVGVEEKEGISVSLRDGKSFTFNQTIDLNDYAGQALEVCKIFPMFRADEDVSPDASTVSVKIVDCYDSTKFVEFYIWCGEAGQGVYYAGAGASTQNFTGLEQNRHRPHEMTEEYDGQLYKIHRPQRYQSKTAWGTGLADKTNEHLIQSDGITLIWDLSNHQMKARNGGAARLITDIDSAEIYGENAFHYEDFFTTGEVVLNVEAYNYTANQFELGIEEIFGKSGEELKDGKMVDTEKPQIFVDVEPTVDNTVFLQNRKSVVLPNITKVLDYNYYGNTRMAVYRNYGKRGEALINTENGVFTPEIAGNYTAVYTATDAYGNAGQYLLEMVVTEENSLSYIKTPVEKLVAASSNVLPHIEAEGLNREVAVEVSVTAPNGEQTIVNYNGVDGYEYIPAYAGEYTVTYSFRDNVYEESYSYNVTCVDENSATFQNPFTFPAYFMKGASYTIQPVVAYTAGDGAFQENKATVSVSVDGGEYVVLSEAEMKAYKVEATNTLQFKASYGDSFIVSKEYSVADVGYGKVIDEKDYLSYWQGAYTASEMQESGAVYSFDGDAQLEFINMVSSKNFKATFTVDAVSLDGVVVTLRDVFNPYSNYITYTYRQESNSIVMVTVRQYEEGELVFERDLKTKQKTLLGEYSIVTSSQGVITGEITINNIQSFEKDNALVEIATLGAEDCTVKVSQLNNQAFSPSMRDTKPQMAFVQGNGVWEVNDVYRIEPCYASSVTGSVLSQDIQMTLYSPNGEIVSDVNGVRLEGVEANKFYEVELAQVGQYRVSYEVSCLGSSKKSGSEVLADDDYYIINVSEGIAPTVSFTDGSNAETTIHLAVGSKHTIKEFTVSDNASTPEEIKVYTMICDKNFILEENGYGVETYVFRNVGEFTVCVWAYDQLGNSSFAYYNVVVS